MMTIKDLFNKRVFGNVECIVCGFVNDVCGTDISHGDIFNGKKKTTLPIHIARGITLMLMHDRYGLTYKELSIHSGMNEKSVMKRVSITRNHVYIDNIYMEVFRLVTKSL